MTTFMQALREANIARNVEWENKTAPFSLTFWANELAGEAGEACNILKKLDRERLGVKGSRASLGALQEELGDVIICCDLLAMHQNIDLTASWQQIQFSPPAELNYSLMGAKLAARVGRVCTFAITEGSPLSLLLPSAVSDVVRHTQFIAGWLGIDLARTVTTKFNMTSEKVGLKTRLVA